LWLRRLVAVLFVVAAALFVIGVEAEGDSHHAETTTLTTVHNESAESGAAGQHETTEVSVAGQTESIGESKVLGVDIESPAAVALAVIASVLLAVGMWLRGMRWTALLAAAVAVVFAVFDIAEVVHQLDNSRTGLAVLAGVIAAAHAVAAVTAASITRLGAEPT
jgi:hypothetical protein